MRATRSAASAGSTPGRRGVRLEPRPEPVGQRGPDDRHDGGQRREELVGLLPQEPLEQLVVLERVTRSEEPLLEDRHGVELLGVDRLADPPEEASDLPGDDRVEDLVAAAGERG